MSQPSEPPEPTAPPETRYVALAEALGDEPGVSDAERDEPLARGFAARGLKVNGRLFASLTGGRLLLKLPQARVAALVASGVGQPFTTGKARVMREWVTVDATAGEAWLPLAREALAFVTAASAAPTAARAPRRSRD